MRSKVSDVLILLSAVLMWVLLASPASVTTMAGSVQPVYRAAKSGEVSIQCLVSWDAEALDGILDKLRESGIRITFAVSADWAESHRDELISMSSFGHETALLDEPSEETVTLIESVTGIRPRICVFSRDDPKGYKQAEKLGLTAVRCTVDLDTANGTAEDILERTGRGIGDGSIINVLPTAGFENALVKLTEKIKNIGLDIVPTHKMLYN